MASSNLGQIDLARTVAETTALQWRAADPRASAWVSANAGTGKTHVLTQRVLRLLLDGTPPDRILCLTYTKAAAAEMSKRVFDRLAGWIGLPPDKLSAELEALTGALPDARTAALARTLFTAAIETPGGFKVQTIHAFAERLLQRFPLEAGVPPAFAILDEATTAALKREAIGVVLRDAASNRESALGRALLTAVCYVADAAFEDLLGEALSHRDLLTTLDAAADIDAAIVDLDHAFRDALAVPYAATAEGLRAECADVLDDATLQRLVGILAASPKPSEQKASAMLRTAVGAGEGQRIAACKRYFLTEAFQMRARLLTEATTAAHPELAATLLQAQRRFAEFDRTARALDIVLATTALYRLAHAVHARFTALKQSRAALDFDDLIARTSALFSSSESAAWVLYKLDGGIDHVLVDEAQDTSPEQWRIVGAIVAEFFGDAGAGAEREGRPRTVFAVGDEKQSIYSFQGAEPELFASNGRRFEVAAIGAGRAWHPAALTLSWRTVSPVLDLVDATFADPVRTPGIHSGNTAIIRHQAQRAGHGGFVEIWPLEEQHKADPTDAWSPLEEAGETSPVVRLADRIAGTIGNWLDDGERLASENRPIRAGDILILVRKRQPVAPAIVAALKRRGIPVAGADRITLAGQLVVQDMLALGDFLTLPEDDLALANVLKGPFFGLDDDDLLALAHGRKGTLWKALLDAADAGGAAPRVAHAADQLKRWRKQADFLPPFEFFANVLDRDGGRAKLLCRLGHEAADPLDEFMNLALAFDDDAAPSLTGFLCHLREDDRTIKRDMEQGRDEVRVLTVHGAKGLEAPIVFLPDTTAAGAKQGGAKKLVPLPLRELPEGHAEVSIWPVGGGRGLDAVETAKADVRAAEKAEANRLLYVAMTRPRDRLYVCGFETGQKRPADCWYETIAAGMDEARNAIERRPQIEPNGQPNPQGRHVLRREVRQVAAALAPKRASEAGRAAAPRPQWLSTPAPREVRPAIPFAPSRIAPYDHDASGEPHAYPPEVEVAHRRQLAADTPPPSSADNGGDARFARGTLTHALLEHLPSVQRDDRTRVARGWLAARGGPMTDAVRETIVAETMRVLSDPVFAPLFEDGSRAEVPIAAEIPDPGGGPALILNGQIDRLSIESDRVLIVDYKTNRSPPSRVEDVPEAYVVQLAAYRVALARIFPGRDVRASLLWTATPQLMELPGPLLDRYADRLFELATRPLDLEGRAS